MKLFVFLLCTLCLPAMSMTPEEESLILREELDNLKKAHGDMTTIKSENQEPIPSTQKFVDLESKYFNKKVARKPAIVEEEIEDEVTIKKSAPARKHRSLSRFDGSAPVIKPEPQVPAEQDEASIGDLLESY